MSLAIIDAREWQNRFDLVTGRRRMDTGPLIDKVSAVLQRNPYPGDVDEKSNHWVSMATLDLMAVHDPDLVCLSYAQQYFTGRHFPLSEPERRRVLESVMAEAFFFADTAGVIPVIVGTGDLIPLRGDMDLSMLDGLAISANWSARYCGLHRPTARDLAYVRNLPGVAAIYSKAEWVDLFKAHEPDLDMPADPALMPDHLAVAREGYTFKTMGATLRKPVRIPANNFQVPVYCPLGAVDNLCQIKDLILSHLPRKKIALILLEGVGSAAFPEDHVMCQNGAGWFCNEPGDSFYLTLSQGKHQPFAYPTGYRYFSEDDDNVRFPFSGYMTRYPRNTIGEAYPGKSIAVGNRSMFMHMMFGADISIECFARNLFNQGCMAVMRRLE